MKKSRLTGTVECGNIKIVLNQKEEVFIMEEDIEKLIKAARKIIKGRVVAIAIVDDNRSLLVFSDFNFKVDSLGSDWPAVSLRPLEALEK